MNNIYPSLQLPWSANPSTAEAAYRDAGLVKTKGTIYILPPDENTLRNAFTRPPRSKSRMSSGATALCKHFERGGGSSERNVLHPFWTLPTGSNDNKSAVAAAILDNMLEEAVWKNVMLLHTGVAIYEIRNGKSYGMRWTLHLLQEGISTSTCPSSEDEREGWKLDVVTFRGFVEPITGTNIIPYSDSGLILWKNVSFLSSKKIRLLEDAYAYRPQLPCSGCEHSLNSKGYYTKLQHDFDRLVRQGPIDGERIPSCPTPTDARAQTTQLSQSIFDSWETLRAILGKREGVLRKRWMKKTKEQRTKILRATWPDIPLRHRPDLKGLASLEGDDQSAALQHAIKWPYINVEDLAAGRTLLLLLNSRGYAYPEAFAHADFEATYLGRHFNQLVPQFLNGHSIYLAHCTTPSTYGQLLSWEDDEQAFHRMADRTQFMFGDGFLVLQLQDTLYKSLVELCCQVFQDVERSNITGASLPSLPRLPPLVSNEVSYLDLSTLSLEKPYRLPSSLDTHQLKLLVEARRAAAIDKFWDLREDPPYFAAMIDEVAAHRVEHIVDNLGQSRSHMGDEDFWHVVTCSLISDTYEEVFTFDHLYHQMQMLDDLYAGLPENLNFQQSLPKKFEEVLLDVLYNLRGCVLAQLEYSTIKIAASPALRDKYERYNSGRGHVAAVRLRDGPMSGDRLLSLLAMLRDGRVVEVGLTTLVDEIQRYLNNNLSQLQRMSAFSLHLFSDLALFCQLKHQLDTFYPWSAGFGAKLRVSMNERAQRVFDQSEHRVDFKDVMAHTTCFSAEVAPFHDGFRYPPGRHKSAANIKIVQDAERHLDTLWGKWDDLWHSRTGKSLHAVFGKLGIDVRDVHRTADWAPRVKEELPKVSESALCSPAKYDDEPRLDEKLPRRILSEPPRPKKKTKGVSDPEKSTGLHTELAELQVSPENHLQNYKTFKVSKRAQKVLSSLFFNPTEYEEVPGEIAWKDFSHTMTTIGFTIEKRYGSAWQFTPTEMHVETPIQFHEPHPSGKIRWEVARRMGRRLTRNYGLTAENFTLA